MSNILYDKKNSKKKLAKEQHCFNIEAKYDHGFIHCQIKIVNLYNKQLVILVSFLPNFSMLSSYSIEKI